jgi:hypothetical protein
MSETARPRPPAEEVGDNKPDESEVKERVDVDPRREPNAPNRGHETEYVRHDLDDDAAPDLNADSQTGATADSMPALSDDSSLDQPSDRDELDRPDDVGGP